MSFKYFIHFLSINTIMLFSTANSKIHQKNDLLLNTISDQQYIQSHKVSNKISQAEWNSIKSKITKSKYFISSINKEGFNSSNLVNGMYMNYGNNGQTTLTSLNTDNANKYYIHLKLYSLSYHSEPDSISIFGHPDKITFNENQLSYHWNNNITENWVNSGHKIEQWFHIKQRLNDPNNFDYQGKLQINIQLDTNLEMNLTNDKLAFDHISYEGLEVWDANGKKITAKLDISNNNLKIIVDEKLATYPLIIKSNLTHHTYLKASNTGFTDLFGSSVAISNDTLVIGAINEGSNATGTNGDQNNELAPLSGAAYVFVRSDNTWIQQAYLKPSNTGSYDAFGFSADIDGDTIVIGAPSESSSASGINGDGNDNSKGRSGAAYVYVRNGSTWTQQAYLKASNTDALDWFGISVAVYGDTVIVGAPQESSNSIGVNGEEIDNSAPSAGAAYVFVNNEGTWSQQAYLKASNAEEGDRFGSAVSISNGTIVVSADSESSSTTIVNGDETNNAASNSGAAYVFTRNNEKWIQQSYIKAFNTGSGDFFGSSIDIDHDTIVVGAPSENSNAEGVNGNGSDNSALDSGAAYIFKRDNNIWFQEAYLKASNNDINDQFGISVAISGDKVLIGSRSEDSNATGINGDQIDNSASSSGASYLFTHNGCNWSQEAYIKASNTGSGDVFGINVSISSNTILAGAPVESSSATGVNGDQNNNDFLRAGAAYVIEYNHDTEIIFKSSFECP